MTDAFSRRRELRFAAVRALRAEGHDVLAVAEVLPRAEDVRVLRLAVRGRRVLLTEDKDFGQLVYAEGKAATGVVLIRFPASARRGLGAAVSGLVAAIGPRLARSFVVLQPGRSRILRSPRR
ncbi:MAG: DUF5615 family PIN-like protein [bacterium]